MSIALVVVLVAGSAAVWWLTRPQGPTSQSPPPETGVVQRLQSGELDIVVSTPSGALRNGQNTLTLEFRSRAGQLVDVGQVRVAANMTMPGMVMSGNVQVEATGAPGRFTVTVEFAMAGAWPITIEWDGPAGRGSATFEGSVQ